MKTDQELEQLASRISISATNSGHVSDWLPNALKLLRSIELDAWREARELVAARHGEVVVDKRLVRDPAVAEMDRLIQQLQLK